MNFSMHVLQAVSDAVLRSPFKACLVTNRAVQCCTHLEDPPVGKGPVANWLTMACRYTSERKKPATSKPCIESLLCCLQKCYSRGSVGGLALPIRIPCAPKASHSLQRWLYDRMWKQRAQVSYILSLSPCLYIC